MQETRVRSLDREDPSGEENGNPLQYSCLENLIDRVAWWATIHRSTKSQTQLSVTNTHTHTQFLNPPPLQLHYRNKFPWARWEETDHPCQQVRDRLVAEGGLDRRAAPVWRGAAAADSRAGEPQQQQRHPGSRIAVGLRVDMEDMGSLCVVTFAQKFLSSLRRSVTSLSPIKLCQPWAFCFLKKIPHFSMRIPKQSSFFDNRNTRTPRAVHIYKMTKYQRIIFNI